MSKIFFLNEIEKKFFFVELQHKTIFLFLSQIFVAKRKKLSSADLFQIFRPFLNRVMSWKERERESNGERKRKKEREKERERMREI